MRIIVLKIFIIASFIVFFFSCKNELNINAPYKEVPSVYAVLNPQDPIQMIRINKVFLGEGNANEMAQISDSINYRVPFVIFFIAPFTKEQQITIFFCLPVWLPSIGRKAAFFWYRPVSMSDGFLFWDGQIIKQG